jgi:hypothetical protein
MDVKKELKFICDEITSILRYAESKHSIFIAFNGVAIFSGMGILRSLFSGESDPVVKYIMCFTMFCLMLAICSCMLSFFPQILKDSLKTEQQDKTNILFFEHIKAHTVDSYIKIVCDKYGANPQDIGQLERCIIAQIIVNATLASRKFRLFKIAVSFDMLAVTAGLGCFLLNLILT